jgi:predicted amidohydrolase
MLTTNSTKYSKKPKNFYKRTKLNMHLTVSGIQMPVTPNIQQNLNTLCLAIEKAHESGAHILLTPEGSLSGYTPQFDPSEVDAALAQVINLASRLQVGLALGTCYREPDGLVYDQLRFYSRQGAFLGAHSKILLCGTLTDPPEGEINDYATSKLSLFSFEGIPIGGLVCNDMWANPQCTPMSDPHLSQQLAEMGARILFHAVNGGRDGGPWSTGPTWNYHESNLRLRATAGKLWIVTVDNSYPHDLPCSAPGGVLNPQGDWVCRTKPLGEQFFVYNIEM